MSLERNVHETKRPRHFTRIISDDSHLYKIHFHNMKSQICCERSGRVTFTAHNLL